VQEAHDVLRDWLWSASSDVDAPVHVGHVALRHVGLAWLEFRELPGFRGCGRPAAWSRGFDEFAQRPSMRADAVVRR
jgi:hypothetical protein